MSRRINLVHLVSRSWPIFVFFMLTLALSVAVAEDYSNMNTGASPEAADAAQTQGFQPLGVQPAEQIRAPAEASPPSEQEQQQAPAQGSPDQNINPNANQ